MNIASSFGCIDIYAMSNSYGHKQEELPTLTSIIGQVIRKKFQNAKRTKKSKQINDKNKDESGSTKYTVNKLKMKKLPSELQQPLIT